MCGTTGALAYVGDAVDKTNWKVSASSWCWDDAETGTGTKGNINQIIDGITTGENFWHSSYRDNGEGYLSTDGGIPEWFIIDMGKDVDLGGVGYLPRQCDITSQNGMVNGYKIFLATSEQEGTFNLTTPVTSADDKTTASNLTGEVASGNFEKSLDLKTVRFDEKKTARYILFLVTSSYGYNSSYDNKYASCAEFYAYGWSDQKTKVDVTYKVLDSEGTALASKKVTAKIGSNASMPDEWMRDYCTYSDLSVTTIQENTTEITTTVTWELPFTPTKDIASNWNSANWYLLKINRNPQVYSSYAASSNSATNSSTTPSLLTSDGGTNYNFNGTPLFAFEGDPINGFKIYNYAAGSGKVLWSSNVSDNATINFTDLTNVTDGSDWQLLKNAKDENFTVFKKIGTDLGYMNDVNSTIGYWQNSNAATDAGSSFEFVKVDMDALNSFAEAASKAQNYPITTTGELNKYVETAAGNMAAALNQAKELMYANYSEKINEAKNALNSATSGLSIVLPAQGSFIRIQSKPSGNYLYSRNSSSSTGRAYIGSSDNSTAESIFYYNENSQLLGFSNGYYLAPNSNHVYFNGIVENPSVVEFREAQNGETGCYNVTINKGTNNERCLYAYSDGKDYTDCWNTGGNVSNCNFYLEKVTALPVTVTAAGYATLNAPVNLTIPDGVNAYYVSGTEEKDGDTYAVFAEITGTIPAKTPVVIEASEGTYNFTITSGDASIEGTNHLTGVVAAKNVTEGSNIYTLQKPADSQVGFYPYSGTELKGFKAYFTLGAQEAAPKAFLFGTDGTVSGIGAVNADTHTAAKAIYDLQGRRVTKATKGVYIVDGKKVILK